MKAYKNYETGITLIALVVTIVVLLILASVSITVVFGDNGILQLAKEAGEKTNEAVKNDISSIGELEDILHETQTGIVVEKVTDTNPGELEQDGTGTNTYTINSIEDLVFFAHNVTSGTETYEGKTVKLGLSLDFASTKSYVEANRTDYGEYGYNGELKKLLNESGFIPIGTQEGLADEEKSNKSFHGTFDGDGNTIYNLKIKEENISDSDKFFGTGMFVLNYGNIQCLGIEYANVDVNIDIDLENDVWKYIGILAAKMQEGSKIYKCHVSGEIVGSISRWCDVGGIVGETVGSIYNSYCNVSIKVLGEEKDDGMIIIGPIVGSCNKGGKIENVYSKGTIYGSGKGTIGLGAGSMKESMKNSYTVCKLKVNSGEAEGLRLRTFGHSFDAITSNCYYLDNSINEMKNVEGVIMESNNTSIGIGTTEEEVRSKKMVDALNDGNNGELVWKQDTNNINDGYPILSWQ